MVILGILPIEGVIPMPDCSLFDPACAQGILDQFTIFGEIFWVSAALIIQYHQYTETPSTKKHEDDEDW